MGASEQAISKLLGKAKGITSIPSIEELQALAPLAST